MQIKFKIAVIPVFLILLFCACKKQTNNPIEAVTTTPYVQQTDTANYIYGWLRKYSEYRSDAGQKKHFFKYIFGCAYFSWTPISIKNESDSINNIPGMYVQVDGSLKFKVQANGSYISSILSYEPDKTSSASWNVYSGSVGIPSFTAICTQAFPFSEDYKTVPPLIVKENGITFSFTKYINTERIKIYLSDNIHPTISKELFLTGNSATIIFTKSELQGLTSTNNGTIDIYFYNDEIQRIQNKNYRFSSVTRDLISNVAILN